MAQDGKTDRPTREPLSRDMEALEARIRHKIEMKEPLSLDERAFFARMPADKGVTPEGAGELSGRESREDAS